MMNMSIHSDSDTVLYILMSLKIPRRCCGISDYIERITDGRVKPGAGTVYSTVSRMRRKKIITVYDNRSYGTVYELTALGQNILQGQKDRIERLHNAIGLSSAPGQT